MLSESLRCLTTILKHVCHGCGANLGWFGGFQAHLLLLEKLGTDHTVSTCLWGWSSCWHLHVITLSGHVGNLSGSIATMASVGVSVVIMRWKLLDLFLLQHIGDEKPPLTILWWILRHLILLLRTPVRDEITCKNVSWLLVWQADYFLIVLVCSVRSLMPELRMEFIFTLGALQIDNLSLGWEDPISLQSVLTFVHGRLVCIPIRVLTVRFATNDFLQWWLRPFSASHVFEHINHLPIALVLGKAVLHRLIILLLGCAVVPYPLIRTYFFVLLLMLVRLNLHLLS